VKSTPKKRLISRILPFKPVIGGEKIGDYGV
jgi:hypothetical protein